MKSICIFTGSNRGIEPAYSVAAAALGSEIARRGMRLVYGAGKVGLMGVIADAALAAGGEVTGVIPKALMKKELAHSELSELHVVSSMHERKAMFSEFSDGFAAMPGGLGTLEELFEVLTWAQLGFHAKPVALFNVAGYFDELLQFIDKSVHNEFVHARHREMIISDTEPGRLLDAMCAYRPPAVSKWIDRAEEL